MVTSVTVPVYYTTSVAAVSSITDGQLQAGTVSMSVVTSMTVVASTITTTGCSSYTTVVPVYTAPSNGSSYTTGAPSASITPYSPIGANSASSFGPSMAALAAVIGVAAYFL
jgi:hypothetical protein